MVGVEQWAEIRRMYFVERLSKRRSTGGRGCIATRSARVGGGGAAALRAGAGRVEARSVQGVDPASCCARIRRCRAQRLRELIESSGYDGGKTILDDYVREVRPRFRRRGRSSARSIGRASLPVRSVGAARAESRSATARRAAATWSSRALGYSRAGAGALVFSKEPPDVLWGIAALPVAARCAAGEAGLGPRGRASTPAAAARPTRSRLLRAARGRLGDPASRRDPQAKGVVRAARSGFMRAQLRAGPAVRERARLPAAARRWCDKVNQRVHRSAARRPGRAAASRSGSGCGRCPPRLPDLDRRLVIRVPQQPYLRVDRNDYSLDPGLVGRRVELRVSQTRGDRGRARHRRARLPPPARASPAASRSPTPSTSARSSGCAATPRP